ncbi:hypothetical protein [Mycobacterium sp. pW045]|uniref:hypothetical protein n=1 Tax=Mycobacterium sp. pW045 TaxID=3238984 RepID=UPI00351B99F8
MIRNDFEQPNLIDGTIVAWEPCAEGAYVTFKGGLDGQAIIASVDIADLKLLGVAVLKSVADFDPDRRAEDQVRITTRGVQILGEMLGQSEI